jgi:hypothetical protein
LLIKYYKRVPKKSDVEDVNIIDRDFWEHYCGCGGSQKANINVVIEPLELCEVVILETSGLDGLWACFLPSFSDF